MDYRVFPPEELIEEGVVELPLSKSISNRALVLSALTPGAGAPERLAGCTDTEALADALGSGLTGEVNVGGAGTAMRFLAAYYAATPGSAGALSDSSWRRSATAARRSNMPGRKDSRRLESRVNSSKGDA